MSDQLRIVVLSDTHGMHERVQVPEGDVLVHCGDFTKYGRESEVASLATWLEGQPHKHKLVTAGNHDKFVEQSSGSARAILKSIGAELLLSEERVIDGVKFWGSPVTPTFFDWSFMLDRGSPIANVWAEIPEDVDVLITHGPPYGHGDLAPAYRTAQPKVAGCLDLLNRIRAIYRATGGQHPRVHLFGHIHAGYGATQSDEFGNLVFINAATCTEQYKPTNRPIEFSIPKRG